MGIVIVKRSGRVTLQRWDGIASKRVKDTLFWGNQVLYFSVQVIAGKLLRVRTGLATSVLYKNRWANCAWSPILMGRCLGGVLLGRENQLLVPD
jgi:hypothetical protein